MLLEQPVEIIWCIMSYCDIEDRKRLSACAKKCNEILRPLLWKNVFIPFSYLSNKQEEDEQHHQEQQQQPQQQQQQQQQQESERTIDGLNHTHVMWFGARPDIYNRHFEMSDRSKELFQECFQRFFMNCDPELLHTCFIPDDKSFLPHPFERLESLHVYGHAVNDSSLVVIGGIMSLQVLGITGAGFTDKGFSAIRSLEHLDTLYIKECNDLTDDMLTHVGSMVKLTDLKINECRCITRRGLKHLQSLTQLQWLIIRECGIYITDEECRYIGMLVELKELYVSFSHRLTDVGLSHLRNLIHLEELDLAVDLNTNITNEGFDSIVKMVELKELDVGFRNDRLTGVGFRQLQALPMLEKLNCVVLDNDASAVAAIAKISTLKLLNLRSSALVSWNACRRLSQLTNLESLTVGFDVTITDGLSHVGEFIALKRIVLRGDKGDGDSFCEFHYLKQLLNLEELSISMTTLYEDGMNDRQMRDIFSTTQLKKLELSYCQRFPEVHFKDIRNLSTLEELVLMDCELNNAHIHHIGSLLNLVELRFGCALTDLCTINDLKPLAALVNLKLLHIRMTESQCMDDQMKHIGELRLLENLHLRNVCITDTGLSYLASLVQLIEVSLLGCDEVTVHGLKYLGNLKHLEKVFVNEVFQYQHVQSVVEYAKIVCGEGIEEEEEEEDGGGGLIDG